MVLLAMLFMLPAVWAVYSSLTNLALLDVSARNPQFVGLDNYRRLWNDPDFSKYVRNSVVFILAAAVVGQTLLGSGLALLLHVSKRTGSRLTGAAFLCVMAAWISPALLTG